jgi:hypothetical protein
MRSYRELEKMKDRERGTHRSLADGGGTAATSVQKKVQSPSNVAEERCGGGGVVDRGVGRRRASASAGSRSTVVAMLFLCSSVQR